MMARINIEEKWWSDPRRGLLGDLLGNRFFVLEVISSAWRLAQTYWEKGELIPGHIFVTIFGYQQILESNLAVLYKNSMLEPNTDPTNIQQDPTSIQQIKMLVQQNFVYVRGTKEYLSWGAEIRQKRSVAGKKSAQRARDSRGRLLKLSTDIQQTSNTDPTKSNTVQLSGSGSGSGSGSESSSGSKKNKNNIAGIRLDYPPEFDELWLLYDRKGDKKASYREYKALGLDSGGDENLKRAILNYQKAKTDSQFRKDFERFLKTDWREWLNPVSQPNGVHPKTQERLNVFERFKARNAAKEIKASENGGENES